MKKPLVLCVLLTSCATVSQMQTKCEEQYTKFREVVNCTEQQISADVRGKKSQEAKLYILKGKSLADKVDAGELSDTDARLEWQTLFVELKGKESQESTNAAARYKAYKPTTTHCSAVGNTVNCNSY